MGDEQSWGGLAQRKTHSRELRQTVQAKGALISNKRRRAEALNGTLGG